MPDSMDISSVTSSSAAANFLDPDQASRPTGKQTLDVNDFLKLMTVQLTSQDNNFKFYGL